MTKSLQLARLFARSGHRVILAETEKYRASGHAYSNCVSKFYVLPNQEKGFDEICDGLDAIVKKESVDLYVPVASPTSVYIDAAWKARGSACCDVLAYEEETLFTLDDKFQFCKKARELGLTAPEVHLITNLADFDKIEFRPDGKKYILKSLAYDPVERLNRPLLPSENQYEYLSDLIISVQNPWVLQEFVEGKEYCTHSTVRNGKILLHTCCPSSDFQLRYRHIDNKLIYSWVESFVSRLNLTGQISFDFIINDEDKVMPLECNPRTHSAITTFYNSTCVATAYLGHCKEVEQCYPNTEARETYWLYYELWKLCTASAWREVYSHLKLLIYGKEAILDARDPLPFLMVYHWQIPCLLLSAAVARKKWTRIDFNIGKLVEVGGD